VNIVKQDFVNEEGYESSYILQHPLTVVSIGLLMSAVPRTLESSVPLR
jgi:hypothetical protein